MRGNPNWAQDNVLEPFSLTRTRPSFDQAKVLLGFWISAIAGIQFSSLRNFEKPFELLQKLHRYYETLRIPLKRKRDNSVKVPQTLTLKGKKIDIASEVTSTYVREILYNGALLISVIYAFQWNYFLIEFFSLSRLQIFIRFPLFYNKYEVRLFTRNQNLEPSHC